MVEPDAKVAFELTRKEGAALITRYPTYREAIERDKTFVEYVEKHFDSWVDFAESGGHPEDIRPVLVTGVDLTRDFAMIAYSDNQTRMECGFSAAVPGVASASASMWGSWNNTGLVHKNCGPPPTRGSRNSSESSAPESEIPDGYTQCVFIKYYKYRRGHAVRKILGLPTVLKAGAGPHQLPKGDRENSGEEGLRVFSPEAEPDSPEAGPSRDEVIHNVPTVGPIHLTSLSIAHELDQV